MDNFKTQVLLNPPNASLIGVGDVDGPTSSTDNAVALFDGTGGKTIKNSPSTITGATTATFTLGAAGNGVIVAGTGNSRVLQLQSTTSGGTATTGIYIGATQNTLLGGLTTDGTGVLQFPAATTSAGGITFGTDINLFRTGANAWQITAEDSSFTGNLYIGATKSFRFSGTQTGFSLSGGSLLLTTNNVTALTLDSSQNVNVNAGELQTAGNRVGYNLSAYGAGTAYAFTNTAAAIDFGTTDPVKVLDKAGTYLIYAQVLLAYNGATVVAETATVKVRRTNNTAADLSQVVVIDLPVSTTLTHSYGTVTIPPFVYTTAATDDSITLFGNVSAALGAGTIDATAVGTSIIAVRLY